MSMTDGLALQAALNQLEAYAKETRNRYVCPMDRRPSVPNHVCPLGVSLTTSANELPGRYGISSQPSSKVSLTMLASVVFTC